mgnify:CR=1 FL=1
MSRNNFSRDDSREGQPYITQIPARDGQGDVDQDVDLRPTRDLGQGSHVQRQDPIHVDGHADASYQGYGAYATLDGSRVDDSEFADPDWAGVKLEPERPVTAGPGHHVSLGPRSYRRPDKRVHEQICEMLTEDSHIDASEIDVSVENGEVLLSGTVESRRLKHLAEDISYRVSGVLDVTNRLKVGPLAAPTRSPEPTSDTEDDGPTLTNSALQARREDADLRRQGDGEDQAERARDRRNLRDYDYQGLRDTSYGERIGKF